MNKNKAGAVFIVLREQRRDEICNRRYRQHEAMSDKKEST